MNPTMLELLACPRCRGPLLRDGDRALRCGCGAEFPVIGGTPRLADGAGGRDPRIAAELEAQHHALPLYVDKQSVMNRWEELMFERLLEWLGPGDTPVLDLGCGVGVLGRLWAESGQRAPLIGMDLVVELLNEAGNGYIGLVEGDVHHMPFRDGAFAGVIMANALHHVADPVSALREVRRSLRPGGALVTYDPRELAPIELAKKVLRRGNDAFGEHHRAFRVDEYRGFFEDAGLRVERFAVTDPVAPLVAAGLDMMHAGRFGLTERAARALKRLDEGIERVVGEGRIGLMLVARATRA